MTTTPSDAPADNTTRPAHQSDADGAYLTLDEARDDSFRSWRLAIDELARR